MKINCRDPGSRAGTLVWAGRVTVKTGKPGCDESHSWPPGSWPSKSRFRPLAFRTDAWRTSPTRLGNQTCLRTSCAKRSLPSARFRPFAHRAAPTSANRNDTPDTPPACYLLSSHQVVSSIQPITAQRMMSRRLRGGRVVGRPDCGAPRRRQSENVAEEGDTEWGWGSPRAFAKTNTLERRFSAASSLRAHCTATPL